MHGCSSSGVGKEKEKKETQKTKVSLGGVARSGHRRSKTVSSQSLFEDGKNSNRKSRSRRKSRSAS
jgi:hypothetical protein